MNKSQIKKIFKDHKVQLGAGAIEMIEDHLRRQVSKMAENCKNGNAKRLTPDLFWIALGKYNER